MRILLIGAEGMLSTDLVTVLSERYEVIAADLPNIDITDPKSVQDWVATSTPHVIVHAAAYTDVEGAEDESERAFLVNETGTRNVALAAQEAGASLVYFSTDFVFDGKKATPYVESDQPNPQGEYAKSKVAGEQQAALAERHCILRTAWLYGPRKANFVEKIIFYARQRGRLKVISEEIGSPTYTLDLSMAVAAAIESGMIGLYHVTNAGSCSRYEFATEIVRLAGLDHVVVEPATTAEIGMKAARPAFGVLSNALWESSGGPPLRHWKDALKSYLNDRKDRWTLLQSENATRKAKEPC
jgi:dTDP-4-dehydrorhamnose reductase